MTAVSVLFIRQGDLKYMRICEFSDGIIKLTVVCLKSGVITEIVGTNSCIASLNDIFHKKCITLLIFLSKNIF